LPQPRKPTPAKCCEMCGANMVRSLNASGRLEDRGAFLRRRFCSLSCANSQRKGGDSRKAWHAQARKHRGHRCEACHHIPTNSQHLHVHHINGDWRDNRKENLQTLCARCHKSWHMFLAHEGLAPTQPVPFGRFPLPEKPPAEWASCAPTGTPSSRKSLRRS
jgi:hypothetical protein